MARAFYRSDALFPITLIMKCTIYTGKPERRPDFNPAGLGGSAPGRPPSYFDRAPQYTALPIRDANRIRRAIPLNLEEIKQFIAVPHAELEPVIERLARVVIAGAEG